MEKLSSMTTRADSGSGVRQKSGSGVESSTSRFERMFEEELSKYDSRFPEKRMSTEENGKNVRHVIENQKEDNADKTFEAGVMGNLYNEVVFILEGDSKSITPPEMSVENTLVPPETYQLADPGTIEINPGIKPEPPIYSQVAEAINAELNKTAAANNEINGAINTTISEEVLARMPEIRTQDSQNNTENNSRFFENGNPSPLENENNESLVTAGQTEKTYSQAVDAAKNAIKSEGKTEKTNAHIPVNEMTPPLSEGIKPEQFKAAQQMTQAALNTPVKTENLFQEMISRVEMMQNDSKSTMTIQLNPEFLGKVALEVSVDAAGLHVKINAEDSGVRSMINGQLATLIESLEHKGIEVVGVEVAYTGVNYGTFQDPREGGQEQGRHHHTAKREVSTTDGAAYYASLPDLMEYYLESGQSSVEYSA